MGKKRKMNLIVTGTAEHFHTALGPEGRKTLDNWFEHLRNWHTDPFARNHSRRLKPDEEYYALQTSDTNLILAYRIKGDDIIAEAVVEEEWVKAFHRSQPSTTS